MRLRLAGTAGQRSGSGPSGPISRPLCQTAGPGADPEGHGSEHTPPHHTPFPVLPRAGLVEGACGGAQCHPCHPVSHPGIQLEWACTHTETGQPAS